VHGDVTVVLEVALVDGPGGTAEVPDAADPHAVDGDDVGSPIRSRGREPVLLSTLEALADHTPLQQPGRRSVALREPHLHGDRFHVGHYATTTGEETNMRALVPTSDERLVEMADVAEPVAHDGEVLIAVEAFSVNRGELFLLAEPRPHWRPGQDVAGTVVQSTEGAPRPGTRVVGLADWEGWAERVTVPASRVTALPDGLSTTDAAALPLAGITALRVLRRAGSMLGQRLLITGASGGVGHFATELAASAGAEVTVVTRSRERGARLAELGAAAVVHGVNDAEGKFDVVFETVAGDVFSAALAKVRPDGLVFWFGQASREPITVPFGAAMAAHGVRIEVFSYHYTPAARGDDLATLVRLVSEGRLHIEVGHEAPWEQTSQVLADLRDRKIRGKAVLTVD
jgi:NADPH:quinone reductase-like Zn-dependent oxidoreductase